MALPARALYDFRAENPGEVSLRESEVLSLCSEQDIDGWLEGVNSRGERGLFPASYVEVLCGEPSGPPPPPPPALGDSRYANLPTGGYEPAQPFQSVAAPHLGLAFQPRAPSLGYQTSQPSDDDWDDEWDDSSSTAADEPAGQPAGSYSAGYHDYENSGSSRFRLSTRSDLPPGPYSTSASIASSQAAGKGSATVGRNLNRFSAFVKSGGEAFVLGEAAGFVRDGDKLCLVQGPDGPEWQENPYPFRCNIDEPTKQTKFKGMKSYISYRLLPSHTGLQVHRRYKHFDWLYARLLYKFPVISVPRIPEKQATGRFEEDFISKRRKGLVWWMDHMCSHPVLARCDAFQHFLTCTDDKAWKQGKRKCERDDMVGANFFLTLSLSPGSPVLDPHDVDGRLDGFKAFTKRMDEGVLLLSQTAGEFARKQASGFKKEYQKVGLAVKGLGQAFEIDQMAFSAGFNRAMAFTGEAYEAIGEMFAEQPRQDLDPIMDLLSVYQGHLANFPDIIHMQRGALTKVRESKKQVEEGKLELQKSSEIQDRCNVISYATLAEIHHFHKIRVRDFKSQMQHFLQQQIRFFQKVTLKLEEALQQYDAA
ncbi:sorting nexin 18 L homeolog [Xenopus laevis]|uniref:Sorting nexin n=1 Tax=Xenopus laevis TaxID=8355 RepID=Q6DDP0_XENLA|nr:sorting nexin 18 L homeolog [Xenopus laevis]AAH77503.1 Snag1-prov protein [Xenopus laevis]